MFLMTVTADAYQQSYERMKLQNRSELQLPASGYIQSHVVPFTSDILQGPVLGPLLSVIYINDLPSSLTSTVCFFTDSCAIYHEITSLLEHSSLQSNLTLVQEWCSAQQIPLTIYKCNTVLLSQPCIISHFPYTVDVILSQADTYRYVGIHLSANMIWNMHTEHSQECQLLTWLCLSGFEAGISSLKASNTPHFHRP